MPGTVDPCGDAKASGLGGSLGSPVGPGWVYPAGRWAVFPHATAMPVQDIWGISHLYFNPSRGDVGFAVWRSSGRGPGPDLAAGGAGGLLLNVTSSCADTHGSGA